MQHYAIPTRLLDWTENPLVGLYFAAQDCPGNSKPAAALWCLYPQELNKISGVVLTPEDDIPAFGDETELEDYLPSQVRLGNSTKNPLAVTAARRFDRVYAQKGVFTIQHREIIRIEELQNPSGIHARFTGRTLSIITIRTNDIDLIEDMFSRLNEAVPLNAAEKRNALGGPLPAVIRELVKDTFFTDRLSVSSTRYRHFDLACKFLYLESHGGAAETKKKTLDSFVEEYAKKRFKKKAQELIAAVRPTLRSMSSTFKKKDPLLKSPSTDVVYFLLFRRLRAAAKTPKLSRNDFERFEERLEANREAAEKELPSANWELREYDRLSQTPNDASAIEFRLKILRKFVAGQDTAD